jgi:hypothetical protein
MGDGEDDGDLIMTLAVSGVLFVVILMIVLLVITLLLLGLFMFVTPQTIK